jgi:predicted PurR-regulated permease PerM
VDVHPVSVTFAVLVMGSIFGVIGALIAVPTIVIIKTIYQELYQNRQVRDAKELEAESERIVNEPEQDEASEARKAPGDRRPLEQP